MTFLLLNFVLQFQKYAMAAIYFGEYLFIFGVDHIDSKNSHKSFKYFEKKFDRNKLLIITIKVNLWCYGQFLPLGFYYYVFFIHNIGLY